MNDLSKGPVEVDWNRLWLKINSENKREMYTVVWKAYYGSEKNKAKLLDIPLWKKKLVKSII